MLYPVAQGTGDFKKLKSSPEKWREQFLAVNDFLVLVRKKEYEAGELNRTL